MGKKVKVGKARQDKFYKLAKETGYRSRASFKLLQLNRKYEFLQKSRVCIDLCAAPGGWLQVVAQNMPVSSLIIGVDLVPIKSLPNVTTLQEDITTAKCRQALKKELQTWQVDVVLNDGAPNVGQNWLHDAYQQAQLVLAALKLATEFLRKGGWFVTKIFRSKDYQPLIWVFQQLFNHVHATKPQASRNESAEIFVVCQGFLAPTTLDPKFLDPKYVFKDVTGETKAASVRLMKPEKVNKKAEGYEEGVSHLHVPLKVSEFFSSEQYLELLANCHEIIFDDPDVESHKATTLDIKQSCKDVKVLGKKDIRALLNWRKKVNKETKSDSKKVSTTSEVTEEIDSEEAEEEQLDDQIAQIKQAKQQELKSKKRKVFKEKRKLRDKMALGMVIPGDQIEQTDDIDIFDLKKIESKKHLIDVETGDMEEAAKCLGMEEEAEEEEPDNRRKNRKLYDRYDDVDRLDDDGRYVREEPVQDMEQGLTDSEDSSDDEDDALVENPLVVDVLTKEESSKRKTDFWFQKDIFAGIEEEEDEDLDIEQMTEDYKNRGGQIKEKTVQSQKRVMNDEDSEDTGDDGVEDDVMDDDESEEEKETTNPNDAADDSDDDSDYDFNSATEKKLLEQRKEKYKDSKDGFEVVPASEPGHLYKLDPTELAIGEELIKSKKRRREIIENSYNRYTTGDEVLPLWFSVDEAKHNKARPPVTKAQVQEYKDRIKAINLRPIGKVAEAKARKKKKMVRKLEKVRKKANIVTEEEQITDNEKWKQIKDIYKKAGFLKKKKEPLTYVVAKKGTKKKVSRPAGVKGKFKVVDPRMKKDIRKLKGQNKQKKGNKSKARGKKR